MMKKYLYAGAKAVFLNVDVDENVDLMKEASNRFGDDKIYAWLPDFLIWTGRRNTASWALCHDSGDCLPSDREEMARLEEKEETFLLSSDRPDAAECSPHGGFWPCFGVITSMTGPPLPVWN